MSTARILIAADNDIVVADARFAITLVRHGPSVVLVAPAVAAIGARATIGWAYAYLTAGQAEPELLAAIDDDDEVVWYRGSNLDEAVPDERNQTLAGMLAGFPPFRDLDSAACAERIVRMFRRRQWSLDGIQDWPASAGDNTEYPCSDRRDSRS